MTKPKVAQKIPGMFVMQEQSLADNFLRHPVYSVVFVAVVIDWSVVFDVFVVSASAEKYILDIQNVSLLWWY